MIVIEVRVFRKSDPDTTSFSLSFVGLTKQEFVDKGQAFIDSILVRRGLADNYEAWLADAMIVHAPRTSYKWRQ